MIEVLFRLNRVGNGGMMEFRLRSDFSEWDEYDGDESITLIVRPDVDWRVNHEVTKACNGAEKEFRNAVAAAGDGFRFAPWGVEGLTMKASGGRFASDSQWQYGIHLSEDAARALPSETDLFSPGYFHSELTEDDSLGLSFGIGQDVPMPEPLSTIILSETLPLEECFRRSLPMYVAARDDVKTVIAGYPWFLDWGRDTLICLRGMIAAGMLEEAEGIICAMASFEQDGTIPNMIRGKDSSDRATSDAPLWLFVAVKELVEARGKALTWTFTKDCGGRSLAAILTSIADHYRTSLPNGIHCDPRSGLVFSPSHYTWMDTNYPAGTPRQGYPVEIQSLWISALRIMGEMTGNQVYLDLIHQACESFRRLFIRKDGLGLYDCLHGEAGQGADECVTDDTVRPNQLLAVTLFYHVIPEDVAEAVVKACSALMIPGGIRSLDDADVTVEQPVWRDGTLLNNPRHPYIGRYEGDEDTRRKPAYHNGTAWGWMMPLYCEALNKVYGPSENGVVYSLLATVLPAMRRGCLGHIPEIYDGDAPHTGRGCPAQAWSMAEAYRVWKAVAPRPCDDSDMGVRLESEELDNRQQAHFMSSLHLKKKKKK